MTITFKSRQGTGGEVVRTSSRTTTLIIITLLVLAAYMTNPTQADFERFVTDQARLEFGTDGFFSWAAGRLSASLLRVVTYRQDFKLFSVYVIDVPGSTDDSRILGIFRVFIPLPAP